MIPKDNPDMIEAVHLSIDVYGLSHISEFLFEGYSSMTIYIYT